MTDLKLFHYPRACSRVTMVALETIGAPYEDQVINLMAGDHYKPAYKNTNPRGKIPALLIDGTLLTENVAILTWLNETYPEAGLLPRVNSSLAKAKQLSDLVWISSVWHPTVRANKMPSRWTMGDVEPVRERGKDLMKPLMEHLESRLATSKWYYGEAWSIVDTYLYWCYTTAEEGQFSLDGFDHIARHRRAQEQMPAFRAAIAREQK
ncbi:MAG: glutathione S-transferase family protein [Litorimonas sp.]